MPPGGTVPPKRVLAPDDQFQPARCTRQKTRESALTQEVSLGTSSDPKEQATQSPPTATHDSLVPTQSEEYIQMYCDEGK